MTEDTETTTDVDPQASMDEPASAEDSTGSGGALSEGTSDATPVDSETEAGPADADESADGEVSAGVHDDDADDEIDTASVRDRVDDDAPGDALPDETLPAVTAADRLKQLETEGDIAADYLEELLDIADLDGDLDMDVEGDRAAVSIVGSGLGALVGDDGRVLESLQELTRLAIYRETGERSRLMLDIGGYRADVRKNLVALAQEAVQEVRETSEAVKLAPMTPFERKVVHDAVADAGLRSESEGVEPTRCVVILPVA